MVEVFRALGDPVRWTIVNELRQGTRCACVLSNAADVSPSLLSHHLKTLREVGVITGVRRGRWIDYSLCPEMFQQLSAVLVPEAVPV
jgi:ArsR family transcriptional regulator